MAKLTPSYNLQKINPKLAKQWHPSKNPTPEGPALETPGRGYLALPPEGARVELPLSC